MVADRTPARFLFGGDSEQFASGFVVALLVAMTAALAALVAAAAVAFEVVGPLPIGLLLTAVAGLAVLGALLYGALGAGLLSAGTIAVAPYLGVLAVGLVEGSVPFPVVVPAGELRFFAVVGLGLTVVGVGFHELPRVLGASDASDTEV